MSQKILVVDDEREIADLVEVYLKNEDFEVFKYYNATDALKCISEETLSLAILDVMLPDMDGFALCQKIREEYLFPIIMLTARVEDMDKILGLTLGADDYITKPFNPLELVARVKTQLRRYIRYNTPELTRQERVYDSNGLYICPDSHKCSLYGCLLYTSIFFGNWNSVHTDVCHHCYITAVMQAILPPWHGRKRCRL